VRINIWDLLVENNRVKPHRHTAISHSPLSIRMSGRTCTLVGVSCAWFFLFSSGQLCSSNKNRSDWVEVLRHGKRVLSTFSPGFCCGSYPLCLRTTTGRLWSLCVKYRRRKCEDCKSVQLFSTSRAWYEKTEGNEQSIRKPILKHVSDIDTTIYYHYLCYSHGCFCRFVRLMAVGSEGSDLQGWESLPDLRMCTRRL